MRNGWNPKTTCGNPNVPEGVLLHGSHVAPCAGVVVTYYVEDQQTWKVGNGATAKPIKCLDSDMKNLSEYLAGRDVSFRHGDRRQ